MAAIDVEIELIRATAKAAVGRSGGQAVGKAETDTLMSLITRVPHWDKVQALAEFHGTTPQLEQILSQLADGIAPPSVVQALRDRCRVIAAKNLLLCGRLTQACAALERAGIRVLAIKGPTLALLAYGNLGLRQFNDIDLLVPPADFDRGFETLRGLGYEFAYRNNPSQQIRYARALGQVALRDAQGALLELHTSLTEAAYHFPLDSDALWSRRQTVVLQEQTVSTLGNEDLLLYLAAHGAKHDWQYLEWVVDLAQLVTHHVSIDWPVLLQRATALRCRRIVLLSLWLAHETLGLGLPAAIAQACAADGVAMRLARERSRRLLSASGLESGFRIAHFRLRSRERLRDGISYLWASIFSPHAKDWQMFNLPAGWGFLYPIARPLRLVLKHLRPTVQRQ